MDQQAFGARKLLVAFAEADGRFRGLVYTKRSRTLLRALAACLLYMGEGAVAFCDEPVSDGSPPRELLHRFAAARDLSAEYGVHLVDRIGCDDQKCRATRLAAVMPHDQPDRWDVPI